MAGRRSLLALSLLYLILHQPIAPVLCTGERKRGVHFSLIRGIMLEESLCRPSDYRGLCSHLSCAMACVSEDDCSAFYHSKSLDMCVCKVCSVFYPDFSRGNGASIVGVSSTATLNFQPAPRNCFRPNDIPGTHVTFSSTSEDSVALYECRQGYTFISGNGSSVCQSDGVWSPVDIDCVETGCYRFNLQLGKDWYAGRVSVTTTGLTCQRWDTDTPHLRHQDVLDELRTMPVEASNNNYCRCFGSNFIPWCYTIDPDVPYENCDIRRCPIEPR